MSPTKGYVDINSKEYREKLMKTLAEANGDTFSADQGVAYHDDPPNRISLPNGMTPAAGSKALSDVAVALNQEEMFKRTFKFRPWDGANALVQVMTKHFGTTGRGVPIRGMFGSTPPQQIEIETGLNTTTQVPWGHVEFAAFEGKLILGVAQDEEYGMLFQLSILCPKKYGAAVGGFFKLIQDELATNSIYKGKAVRTATGDTGVDEMRFIPVDTDDTIVYSEDVQVGLENTVWGVIKNAELLAKDNRKVNNRVLLFGPYGTGKSEGGKITGKIATDNGWTFFKFESAKGSLDDLQKTIATARLYEPSVVMVEDVDVFAAKDDPNYQSRLSNMFDGIGSKGDKVMILMTSNKPADFSKAMLRAGRIDRMIEIGPLDRDATETMIRKVIGNYRLDPAIDFDKVWEALADFEPAFVRQTFDQAATSAIIRLGSLDYVLTSEDFVAAALILRPQHEMHTKKQERANKATIETLIGETVTKTLAEKTKLSIELSGDYDLAGEGVFSSPENAQL